MKLLSATDHSQHSKAALEFSFYLAKELRCSLVILNVFDVPPISPAFYKKYFKVAEKRERENSIVKTEKFIDELELDFDKSTVDYYIKASFGDPKEVIVSVAKKEKADLIIAGSKGKSALEKLIFGSTTVKMFAASEIPVLAIPESRRYTDIRKIVFYSDYSDNELNDLAKLSAIFVKFQPKIVCVIFKETRQELESETIYNIENQIRRANDDCEFEIKKIVTDDEIESLNTIAQYDSADIIAITTHQRNLIDTFFIPSKAKQLSFNSFIPLLAMSK